MDAKPQRPFRPLRARNDENAPMDFPPAKTIHQRNKSSPALSVAAANMAAKSGLKRTAFNDVSNLHQQVKPSKDDLVLQTKSTSQLMSKPVPAFDKKPAPFNKPAQRPMSVSNLRNLLTGSSNSTTQDNVPKTNSIDSIVQNQSQVYPANSRKVLAKKGTIVFRDTVPTLDVVPELPRQEHSTKGYLQPPNDHTFVKVEPQTISEASLPPPVVDCEPVCEPVKEDAQPASEASLPGIESVSLHPNTLSPPLVFEDATADPIKSDAPLEPLASIDEEFPQVVQTAEEQTKTTVKTVVFPPQISQRAGTGPQLLPFDLKSIPYSNQAELEEYWEEGEQTPIEEEGYVTARSFRSKGENTTGGVTTVVFPQVNHRIRREIAAATAFVEATRNPDELEDEFYDTSMVAVYGDDIFDYMRELEVKMLPNAHYMDNQHEIQWSMRCVLMDWLIQVHHRFNLLPETLFLTVNYIDRFLSCKVVSLGKLQLVGATAIFIAAKYEEINCPSIQEIVYMVDNGYSVDEILKAERFMLSMLQFELGWPGPMSFLRRISKADDYDLETRTLAKYFLEVTVMDERFIGSPPSFTAAASHCLARLMLRKGDWSPHHIYYSGYTWAQLRPLVNLLVDCCVDPRRHHAAVFNKYCDKRFKRAATFVETEMQRGFNLKEAPLKALPAAVPQPFFDTVAYFHG